MAESTVIKNFRDGTILIEDATAGTVLDYTVAYEVGDFSLSGQNQGNYEHSVYLDRGEFAGVRKANRKFPTCSFSVHFRDLSDGTSETLPDMLLKAGAFSAAVSTLGANADVDARKITWTIEGTDLGDASDHVYVLDDFVVDDVSIAEGDPTTINVSGTVYGTPAAT